MRLALFLVAAVLLLGCVQQGEETTVRTLKSTTAEPAVTTTSTSNAVAPTTTPLPTPAPTIAASPAATVSSKKLTEKDFRSIKELIAQFLMTSGWETFCHAGCEDFKLVVSDIICSVSMNDPAGEEDPAVPVSPFPKLLGVSKKDVKDSEKLAEFWRKCMEIAPEVVFDCNAFAKGKLSCGDALKGCENGGFWLKFDRSKFMKATGYDVDEFVFIDSPYFKNALEGKLCASNFK
ncbi:hypothetical protein HZC09_04665 [Candidatus Micrarchaeota archaeon]|nr:hypothetical protein [Candidatus Micrarchaeota archaeon]